MNPNSHTNNPGVINQLFSPDNQPFVLTAKSFFESLFRSIAFAITSMTGLGDLHVKPNSFLGLGYLLIVIQTIWGYVLLGTLITRLAILFTQDGSPAGFDKEDHNT